MANTLNWVTQLWEWLERLATRRAASGSRVESEHVKWRRRELLRRVAGQIGIY